MQHRAVLNTDHTTNQEKCIDKNLGLLRTLKNEKGTNIDIVDRGNKYLQFLVELNVDVVTYRGGKVAGSLGLGGGHEGEILNHFLGVLGLAGAGLAGAQDALVLAVCNRWLAPCYRSIFLRSDVRDSSSSHTITHS